MQTGQHRTQGPSAATSRLADIAGRYTGIEWLRAAQAGEVELPPYVVGLGLDLDDIDEGRVAGHFEARQDHLNGLASVHGGVLGSVADTAGSCAVLSRLPRGVMAPTLEMKINFVRPVRLGGGPLQAEGRVLSQGRTTALAEARIADAEGRLVAFATVTCSLVPIEAVGIA